MTKSNGPDRSKLSIVSALSVMLRRARSSAICIPRAIAPSAESTPANVASGSATAIGRRFSPSPHPSSSTRAEEIGAASTPKRAPMVASLSG
jgi:hypothetical protein